MEATSLFLFALLLATGERESSKKEIEDARVCYACAMIRRKTCYENNTLDNEELAPLNAVETLKQLFIMSVIKVTLKVVHGQVLIRNTIYEFAHKFAFSIRTLLNNNI